MRSSLAGAPPRVLTGMHPAEKGLPRLRHARAQVTRGDGVDTSLELLQAYPLGRLGLGINANPELVPVLRNSGSRRWVVETEHWVCHRVIVESGWPCPRAQPTPRLLLGTCADGTDPGNTHGPESLDTDIESSHAGRFIQCTRGLSVEHCGSAAKLHRLRRLRQLHPLVMRPASVELTPVDARHVSHATLG